MESFLVRHHWTKISTRTQGRKEEGRSMERESMNSFNKFEILDYLSWFFYIFPSSPKLFLPRFQWSLSGMESVAKQMVWHCGRARVSVCVHSFMLAIHLIPAKTEDKIREWSVGEKGIKDRVMDRASSDTEMIWSVTCCSRISWHIRHVKICISKLCVSSNLDEQVVVSHTCEILNNKYSTYFVPWTWQ